MTEQQARQITEALIESSQIAIVGSLGLEGEPQMRAMINADHEGLKTLWFSTNTSSEHVAQFAKDPRACVYFVEWRDGPWRGAALTGAMELLRDRASRERLWHEGDERYYPQGVDDPDYTVLRFTASRGKVYQSLSTGEFEIP